MENSAFEVDVVDFEDVDLFAEDIEERLNSATTSSIASGTSVSTASSCWCSFSTIGSACTSSAITEAG